MPGPFVGAAAAAAPVGAAARAAQAATPETRRYIPHQNRKEKKASLQRDKAFQHQEKREARHDKWGCCGEPPKTESRDTTTGLKRCKIFPCLLYR